MLTSTPAEFTSLIAKEIERYRTIMRELEIKPQ